MIGVSCVTPLPPPLPVLVLGRTTQQGRSIGDGEPLAAAFVAATLVSHGVEKKKGNKGWEDGQWLLTSLKAMTTALSDGKTVIALCDHGKNRWVSFLIVGQQGCLVLISSCIPPCRSAMIAIAACLIGMYSMKSPPVLLPTLRSDQKTVIDMLIVVLKSMRVVTMAGRRHDAPRLVVSDEEFASAADTLSKFHGQCSSILESLAGLIYVVATGTPPIVAAERRKRKRVGDVECWYDRNVVRTLMHRSVAEDEPPVRKLQKLL